jgi:hypothetical protein
MRRSHWLAALCLLAFGLSCAYLSFYLRGGPRIIDATSYFLQARSLAAGAFSFDVPEPTAAFGGRFLLASADGHQLGVIFPPGYPLVLALGVRLGAPLLVGPTIGALLVAMTYALARALGQAGKVALLAAGLSMLCAALRYHTADTMSHGLAALLSCAALTFALRPEARWAALCSGLCLGLLLATRPVSGAVSLLLVAYALQRQNRRAWPLLLLGTLPGIVLLLAQQRALTGSFFGSTQLAYYATADAPAGCFRYGFGAGVGCRFEHGDYVSRFLPHGYGVGAALRNLAVHVLLFATDATNALPLTLLAGYALLRHRRTALVVLGAGILLQTLAYVPFYFDGNYPGGGARFLCEAIPFCQILVARAAVDLKAARLAPVAAIAGFVLYARGGHQQLRDRDGGRPAFEPAVAIGADVRHGLLLVDSDHGFNLGHDPRAQSTKTSLVVARAHDDAHDRELYERFGRPPTYRYVFDFKGRTAPYVVAYVPPPKERWEAEAEWPARMQRGSAYPIHFPCASEGKALRLLPGAKASLPVGEGAADGLEVGWLGTTAAGAKVRVSWSGGAARLFSATGPGCVTWRLPGHPPSPGARVEVELVEGEGALDFLTPQPSTSPPASLRPDAR